MDLIAATHLNQMAPGFKISQNFDRFQVLMVTVYFFHKNENLKTLQPKQAEFLQLSAT